MTTFMWTSTNQADLDLAAIRTANIDVLFNYRVVSTVLSPSLITAYLDACHLAGLQVMLSCRELGKNVCIANGGALTPANIAALEAWAVNFADHPALWGWYADDEGTAAEYPAAERVKVYDAVKALNPAKQVLEAHYHIEAGAYTAAAHDVFALDWYPYVYDDYPSAPSYGCISRSTGLVTSASNETAALAQYADKLATAKTLLDAAGDAYIPLMQAFANGPGGSLYYYAMPPTGGLTKLLDVAAAQGFDAVGLGFFLWDSNDLYTAPVEQLIGVAEGGHADLLAELTAIAATTQDPSLFDLATAFLAESGAPVSGTVGSDSDTSGEATLAAAVDAVYYDLAVAFLAECAAAVTVSGEAGSGSGATGAAAGVVPVSGTAGSGSGASGNARGGDVANCPHARPGRVLTHSERPTTTATPVRPRVTSTTRRASLRED